ncbi:MAG: hypothetical protein M1493_12165 [Firmicutes bacterium]|jgi:hypothetical protein|uniref:Uncharacterized protein n=1 Tax=Sulfobacillus benefaciens TaxID=453960 RepID=A0A2T2WYT8_9FIRM|nr:hypothetical protein [Bacillota bacterium]PSR27410.1 MAG: hypothetical protein C7B43_11745 [Sulfobacillus benefaciens]
MKVQLALLSLAAAVMGSAVAVAVGRPHFDALVVPKREGVSAKHTAPLFPRKDVGAYKKTKSAKTIRIPPAAITTTTTPVFAGTNVRIVGGSQTESLLTRGYPLSLNPVAFYQSRYYHVMFELQADLGGETSTLQILQGPGNVVVLTARNHVITGTYVAAGTVQLTNLSGNDAYLSILDSRNSSWLTANLVTGAMRASQMMPLAAELSPYMGGLQTLYPVPEINPGAAVSLPHPVAGSPSEPLIQQCLDEANTLFNTQVGVNSVVLNQSGSFLSLSNLQGGRWQSVRFRLIGRIPVPDRVVTSWNSQTLVYRIAINEQGQAQSVVLPQSEILQLTHYAETLSYTPRDSQAGAVAALPIDLAGYQTLHPGAPKLIVEQGNQVLLALTYQAQTSQHTVYVPVGWYWWQSGPQVLSSVPATPSLSPSTSASTPPSQPSPDKGSTPSLSPASP